MNKMIAAQRRRGPDSNGLYIDPDNAALLGHNRLSIIDLSDAGIQPMSSVDGRYWIVFNGEIYNYVELRSELADYPYRSRTDTEVILAAFQRWGTSCLNHLLGMFAFMIWDRRERCLFAARDRFGVKPLYYYQPPSRGLIVASEIKSLHAAGVPAEPDNQTWSAYLSQGMQSHSNRTFWQDIVELPAGNFLVWQDNQLDVTCWYDLAERVGPDFDTRPLEQVCEEYLSLLTDSVRLRFRADVPVGVNLSGGLDSSILMGLIQKVYGEDNEVKVFTFATGDSHYDELPWVQDMLANTRHPWSVSYLRPADVSELALTIYANQDEPFGGVPTLAYATVFDRARSEDVIVLMDGQGMDEAWAGYDYYDAAINGTPVARVRTIQGTTSSPVRPGALVEEFRKIGDTAQQELPRPFADSLRNLQYRDARFTKLPRALRFNDRISMFSSTELREPFLDHRLFELAMRQSPERKRVGNRGKVLLRQLAHRLLPDGIREAPKRALQTPQREWLRNELQEWANDCIEDGLARYGGTWFDADEVRREWHDFQLGYSDNSFYVWQWISVGLFTRLSRATSTTALDAR